MLNTISYMRVSRRVSTHLPGGEDVVHVLEEGFVLDLLVREEEGDAVALLAGCPVQVLQVLQQVGHVVRPDHMATNMQYQLHQLLSFQALHQYRTRCTIQKMM